MYRIMSDEVIAPYPNLAVPELTFHLLSPSLSHLHSSSFAQLITLIEADEMGAYYRSLHDSPASAAHGVGDGGMGSPKLGRKNLEDGPLGRKDEVLLADLEAKNEAALKELDEKIEEAIKIDGEMEIGEALRAKAMYLTRIGEKVRLHFIISFRVKADWNHRNVLSRLRRKRWRRRPALVPRSISPSHSSESVCFSRCLTSSRSG